MAVIVAYTLDVFGTWFSVGTLDIRWCFNIDLLAAHMFLTVTSVSFAVHLYSLVYMRADPNLNLFLCYLSMFTGFMIILVAADNLMVMLVGCFNALTLHNSMEGDVFSFSILYLSPGTWLV